MSEREERKMNLYVMTLTALGPMALASWAVPDEVDTLQGTWVAVSAQREGVKARDLIGHRLTFDGNRFVIRGADGAVLFEGTWTAKQGELAAIDFHHEGDVLRGKSWKGVYTLQGDELHICDNGADPAKGRPTDLTARPKSGHVSLVFERNAR
jgi:uncharacterized protein (TIGR03067 family)